LAVGGYVDIEVDGVSKRIGINRLHMEEDTAKQFHHGDVTWIDFNRAGTPLVEIVSEPDIRSGKEAAAFVEKMKSLLEFGDISDVKMEEGSLRCDVNISLRPYGYEGFGTKVEIKNLNSVNNVLRAVEAEILRQTEDLFKRGVRCSVDAPI
jgi:aspartyl-tRNA(Asn)/glutamyl-tRNA(Gln) amidotransferase subunit B